RRRPGRRPGLPQRDRREATVGAAAIPGRVRASRAAAASPAKQPRAAARGPRRPPVPADAGRVLLLLERRAPRPDAVRHVPVDDLRTHRPGRDNRADRARRAPRLRALRPLVEAEPGGARAVRREPAPPRASPRRLHAVPLARAV